MVRNGVVSNEKEKLAAMVPLATCLYRTKQFRKSLFYLLMAFKNGLAFQLDCLFYLSVNCYELGEWHPFKRYYIKLLVLDSQKTYVGYIHQLLTKRHHANKYRRFILQVEHS